MMRPINQHPITLHKRRGRMSEGMRFGDRIIYVLDTAPNCCY